MDEDTILKVNRIQQKGISLKEVEKNIDALESAESKKQESETNKKEKE